MRLWWDVLGVELRLPSSAWIIQPRYSSTQYQLSHGSGKVSHMKVEFHEHHTALRGASEIIEGFRFGVTDLANLEKWKLTSMTLSQICDSYLGALSDIQSPPSLPQSNSFLAAFRFFLHPFLLSLVLFFLPMSTSFPALRSLLSPLSTLHCLRPSRSSYPVLCPRLLCLTTSLVIVVFVPPLSGIYIYIVFFWFCVCVWCIAYKRYLVTDALSPWWRMQAIVDLVFSDAYVQGDWFKGKCSRKPHFERENRWFPVDSPLNQSIEGCMFMSGSARCEIMQVQKLRGCIFIFFHWIRRM